MPTSRSERLRFCVGAGARKLRCSVPRSPGAKPQSHGSAAGSASQQSDTGTGTASASQQHDTESSGWQTCPPNATVDTRPNAKITNRLRISPDYPMKWRCQTAQRRSPPVSLWPHEPFSVSPRPRITSSGQRQRPSGSGGRPRPCRWMHSFNPPRFPPDIQGWIAGTCGRSALR